MRVPLTVRPKRNARGVTMNYCSTATKLEVFPRQVYRILASCATCARIFPHFRNRLEKEKPIHARCARNNFMLHYHTFRLSRAIRQENVSFEVVRKRIRNESHPLKYLPQYNLWESIFSHSIIKVWRPGTIITISFYDREKHLTTDIRLSDTLFSGKHIKFILLYSIYIYFVRNCNVIVLGNETNINKYKLSKSCSFAHTIMKIMFKKKWISYRCS